jgi:[ribosomal protein S18]-alanine N-acetyltransferase
MIRAAVKADAAPIARLEADCLGGDAWSLWLVQQGVHGLLPTVHYVVAELDGEVVGYACVSVMAEIAELQRIAVAEPHRREGLASRMLAAVVTRAGALRAERVLLEVRETNDAAVAFYERHGFAEIDRRPRYYRDGTTAIVMRRDVYGRENRSGG